MWKCGRGRPRPFVSPNARRPLYPLPAQLWHAVAFHLFSTPCSFVILFGFPFAPLFLYCAHLFFMCLAPETTHIEGVGKRGGRVGLALKI